MLRAYDANINRAAEGLRVLEDIARFYCDHADYSAQLKCMRHELRQQCPSQALSDRRTSTDVGIGQDAPDENQRRVLSDVIYANAKRAQEALRVLEELGKLHVQNVAPLSAMRYALYDLEQKLIACLPASRLFQELLYVLIDSTLCTDPVQLAQAAQRGGAGIIQLRAKELSQRAYAALAQKMRDVLGRSLFIVNDHVAVAKAIAADGVHLGQDDMSVAHARSVLGPLSIIGVSTHSAEQVLAAEQQAIDYIGMGPIYQTSTKPHEPCRGISLLDEVQPTLPSYAIGGLNAERIQTIREKIPHGVAIAGAVCASDNPEAMCAQLLELLSTSSSSLS